MVLAAISTAATDCIAGFLPRLGIYGISISPFKTDQIDAADVGCKPAVQSKAPLGIVHVK